MMKINRDKRIGRVLFVVEGSRYEFSLLRKIFVDLFHYEYLEKRRSKPDRFISGVDQFSRVAVVNTLESNIRDITENPEYLDDVFQLLMEKYDYPVDQSAIYYVFDRDPESNTDVDRIRQYIDLLKDPYENEGNRRAGQLLLSYPSIESYTITALETQQIGYCRFSLGREAKQYIADRPQIQINKLDDEAVSRAASCFLEYISEYSDHIDVDEFQPVSRRIFEEQELEYVSGKGFRLFSMLTLAFMQMGLVEE